MRTRLRPPCPKHTTSSVHLLTEDREAETEDCVQEGRGPLTTCGCGQRAEVKEALSSPSLQTRASKATATRPVQALSSRPSGNSARGAAAESPCPGESLPATDLVVSHLPWLPVFKGQHRERSIIFYTWTRLGRVYNAHVYFLPGPCQISNSLTTLTSCHPPTGLDQCSAATGSHR